MITINVEQDVRRQYNRRVLFCIRIRGAALIIGLWDLFIHSTALFALVLMFSRLPESEKNLQKISSSTNLVESRTDFLLPSRNEKINLTRPIGNIDAGHFYMNLDFMTLKWIRSLREQDRYVAFVLVASVTTFILVYLWGILTNKPAYLVPYFLIKIFNVLISLFSMLGLYSSFSNVRIWLQMQPDFPLKSSLLQLDNQTIQLIVFAILLFMILAKLYIAAIVWYCYGYITALNMARSIGVFTATYESQPRITGDMYSPPKYEEAIQGRRQEEEEDQPSPPPYTPLLSSL